MPIQLVQIPTDLPLIDETRFPDRDKALIYEHLLHYCSKFDPLPAITVKVEDSSLVVVGGHKYLEMARALRRPHVRAVIAAPASGVDLDRLLARGDVRLLNWEEIRAREDAELTPVGWHVFFFDRALSNEEKADFDNRVEHLFVSIAGGDVVRVRHDDRRQMAEFEAPTPVTDQAWIAKHLATFEAFSRDRVKIVSYQGRRFSG